MTSTTKLERRPYPIRTMVKNPTFWGTQLLVVGISVIHNVLESSTHAPTNLTDFLPISFLWVPLIYAAIRFGLLGSVMTSVVTALTSLPNWLYLQSSMTLWQEISMVITALVISLLVGWQTDRVRSAQKRERKYASMAVRSQEEDRKRLSLNLHDDSIQELISACYELDSMKDIPEPDKLVTVRNSLAAVVQKLREISVSLHPPLLDDLGVVSAVRGLLDDSVNRGVISGRLDITGEPYKLPQDIELTAFRIAQEALRNVERHSQASRARVSITFASREVALEVEDDGIGFDPEDFRDPHEGHLGILGMKERAEMVGGRFELSSKPGKGTTVKAYLPSS
jgi:signal transduction histidine kinase